MLNEWSSRAKVGVVAANENYLNGNLLNSAAQLIAVIGLGPGSTPSGDDFLIGFTTTLHYFNHPFAQVMMKG
jgi:hypothetical protein